jgi:hypothetical protein
MRGRPGNRTVSATEAATRQMTQRASSPTSHQGTRRRRRLAPTTRALLPPGRTAHARSGRAPSVSTDDRLTLASVSNCGSVDVMVRHDRWSSRAGVSQASAETTASRRRRSRGRRPRSAPGARAARHRRDRPPRGLHGHRHVGLHRRGLEIRPRGHRRSRAPRHRRRREGDHRRRDHPGRQAAALGHPGGRVGRRWRTPIGPGTPRFSGGCGQVSNWAETLQKMPVPAEAVQECEVRILHAFDAMWATRPRSWPDDGARLGRMLIGGRLSRRLF